MKKIQNKYTKIAFIAVIAGAILYAIMSVIDNIGLVYRSIAVAVNFILGLLTPVMIGFIIAFLLSRPSAFFIRCLTSIKFFAKRKGVANVIGVMIAFILLISVLVGFIYLVVPGVISSVGSITYDIPKYSNAIDTFLKNMSQDKGLSQIFQFMGIDVSKASSVNALLAQFWNEITSFLRGIMGQVLSFIVNTGLFLYNFVLGLFFAVYMLIYKQEIKCQIRTLSELVFKKVHYKLLFALNIADDMFYKFLMGKAICALTIGILAFIICSMGGFKYSLLISLIIAVSDMIPTFGPIFGAIPAVVLSLMTEPVYGIYIVIIIIFLQMIEGNIIGPYILGDYMGINGFWIMFSIIIMGSLFGVVGMLIAIPVFGMLRVLIKNWIYKKNNGALEGEAEFEASMNRYCDWTLKKSRRHRKKQTPA